MLVLAVRTTRPATLPQHGCSPMISDQLLRSYGRSPMKFFGDMKVQSPAGLVPFREIAADFQLQALAALAPDLQALAKGERPPIGRHFWHWTKGAGKDSLIGMALTWLLAFSDRVQEIRLAAKDREQSGEIRGIFRDAIRHNPWLGEFLEVFNWEIRNRHSDSRAVIVAADELGEHGTRPTVTCIHELAHIANEEFVHTLLDNATKVAGGLLIVASNAGILGSYQEKIYHAAKDSPDRWHVSELNRPAPWISEADLYELWRIEGESRYRRLWWGQWSSGSGDALNFEDIQACITQSGPMRGDEPGYVFFCGVDLGVSADHSAVCCVATHARTKRCRLANIKSWAPPKGGKVDLEAVKAGVLEMHRKYRPVTVAFDPFQCELMAQQLTRQNVRMLPYHFVGRNLSQMASVLIGQFKSGNVELYKADRLVRDLGRLVVVEKSYGHRLESVRDAEGHCDEATSFCLALVQATEHPVFAEGKPPTQMRAEWTPRASHKFTNEPMIRERELRARGSSSGNVPWWVSRVRR